MGGALGGVVAVRAEVAAFLGVVAGHQVALHARGVELEGLVYLRHQARGDALYAALAQLLVFHGTVAAAFVVVLDDLHRLAVALDHVARVEAAMLVVVLDQFLAEGRFEDARDHQHGCLGQGGRWRWKGVLGIEQGEDVVDMAFAAGEHR
ncbi:hypothetical protein D9M68_729400 [compost metagenome]